MFSESITCVDTRSEIMVTILALCRSAHLPTSIMFATWITLLVMVRGSIFIALWSGLATFLITNGVFLKNDINDIVSDRISKPHRPLVSGELNIVLAKRFAYWFFGIGITICFWWCLNEPSWLFLVTYFVLAFSYDFVKQKAAWGKCFFVALCLMMPLCFGIMMSNLWTSSTLTVLGGFFFYVIARELLLDIQDMDGDRDAGILTLSVYYGCHVTRLLAGSMWIISCFILCFNGRDDPLGLILIIGYQCTSSLTLIFYQNVISWRKGLRLTLQWIPMIFLAALMISHQ